jgi:hypothetical protein
MIKTLLIFLLILFTLSIDAKIRHIPKSVFSKRIIQGILFPVFLNPLIITPTYGIPAIEAATQAMLEKKERLVQERDVDKLPPAAKKRKAIALCKDSQALKSAGYLTTAKCIGDAIEGNYDKILGSSSTILPVLSSSSSISVPNIPSESQTKLEKVIDLSGLSSGAKKRKALAACKKPETRKFAKMGSESKCTEQVLQNEYDSLINALEYGK